MNKKGTIVTIVSLKTYFILIVIALVVIFGYYYFFLKSAGIITISKDCPAEIIPERINCNLNERGFCTLNGIGQSDWKDGTSIQFISGFTKGYQEGENVNYLYPSMEGARYFPKYSRQDTGKDGIVKGKIEMGVYLVLNLKDKTEEGYDVVESKCYFLARSSDYYPKKDIVIDTNEEEGTSTNTEEENLKETETIIEGEQIEEQKTPAEVLKEFCLNEFKKLGPHSEIFDSFYFEDYSSASIWIEKKYPNEGSTINSARFFREWYLDQAEFPIYIINGKYEEQPNLVVSDALRVCDENGIIQR
ncbi:MAG: hypothetical protein ABIA78_01280 [archaeon]